MILNTTHRLEPSKLGTIRTLVLFEEQGPGILNDSELFMGADEEVGVEVLG